MKDEELRIGNFVYDYTGNTTKVESIIHEHNRIRKPIQLTEEWAFKFGFKKDKINWNDGSISDDCFVCPNWRFIIFINECGIGFFQLEKLERATYLTGLEYVHQLQNLYFSLTGEKLELKS